MKNKQQIKAWKMIRLNKSLGLKGKKTITQVKVSKFLRENPKTTKLVRFILGNITESPEQIAKMTKKPLGVIMRFYFHAIESVLLGVPKVGSALETPSLKKALIASREGRKEELLTQHVSKGKVVYTGKDKDIIRDFVVTAMLDARSPKTGIVPSLPFKFAMEEKILAKRALSQLTFHGYETGYAPGKSKESRKIQAAQRAILKSNPKLAKNVLMNYANINEAVQVGGSDQYAHILLDYCSSLSANRDAINYVLKNNLVQKGGIIEITLCSRSRERNSKMHLAKMISKYADHYKAEVIPNVKTVSINGSEVKGLHYYSSSMRGMGGIMYVVVLRRIK